MPVVFTLGLGLHLWGMVDKHRLERAVPAAWWVTAAYWLCWVGLAVFAVLIVVRALR